MATTFASPTLVNDPVASSRAAVWTDVGTPYWFPVVMGVLLWIAYGLRNSQLRSFVLTSVR